MRDVLVSHRLVHARHLSVSRLLHPIGPSASHTRERGRGWTSGRRRGVVAPQPGRSEVERAARTSLGGGGAGAKEANATGLLMVSLGVLLIALTHAFSSVSNFFLSIGPNIPAGDPRAGRVQPGIRHRGPRDLPRRDDLGVLELPVGIFGRSESRRRRMKRRNQGSGVLEALTGFRSGKR